MPFSLPAAAGFVSRRLFLSGLAAALLLSVTVRAEEEAEQAPLAPRSLLIALARAGSKLVAVGEHGHILISADEGQTWTQSRVPTRVLLTGVSFSDPTHGWAVGHDGVILATTDGGVTWHHQDAGDQLNTIYLDVRFLDNVHGIAVGAYGKYVSTSDGGRTWAPGKPIDDEVHFNRLTVSPDNSTLYLAGESGLLLTSADRGAAWSRIAVPYEGSLFSLICSDTRTLVLGGLRGHIFLTTDQGANWQPQESEPKVLLMGGLRLRDGTLVFSGQGGHFFISRDAGRSFTHWKPEGFGTSVSDLIEAGDGWVVTVGEAGAVRLRLP
jgi:photosystem II stability/assembly factor-like uncharacterized protein